MLLLANFEVTGFLVNPNFLHYGECIDGFFSSLFPASSISLVALIIVFEHGQVGLCILSKPANSTTKHSAQIMIG